MGRYWLPFLQFIIHLLYIFKIDFVFFKLIPLTFSMMFLFIFTKLGLKVLKGYKLKHSIIFLLLLFFITFPPVFFISTNLYQEIIVIALLYLILYLTYFKKNMIALYIVWIVALITREYFWIYYIVLGFLHKKTILSKRSNMIKYCILLTIPLLWILYTRQSIISGFNASPKALSLAVIILRINKLFFIIKSIKLFPIVLNILVLFLFLMSEVKNKKYFLNRFEKNSLVLSFYSFIFCYTYIILRDPWRWTPYNPRILFPLIIFIPLLYLVFFKFLLTRPNLFKHSLICISAICLLFTVKLPSLAVLKTARSPFYQRIKSILISERKNNYGKPLEIGVIGIDYWNEYVSLFVGPLLYENAKYITYVHAPSVLLDYENIIYVNDVNALSDYQLIITNESSHYSGFENCKIVERSKALSFKVCHKQ